LAARRYACGRFGSEVGDPQRLFNLYRKGQSVARVSQTPAGDLQWVLHRKYLEGDACNDQQPGKLYRIAPAEVRLSNWIQAAEAKAGREKKAIDEILDRDGNVIDLEMGLPANGGQKSAVRIDMVSVETVNATTTSLMFWEVKTFDDSRIRTSGNLPTESGILAQVDAYRRFLADPGRALMVRTAYRRCAALLLTIAKSVGAEDQLGQELCALAGGKALVLADQPGLLIAMPERELSGRSRVAWNVHRQKLEDAGLKLRIEPVTALN
jgi:hypothetical protein